jgi:serine phosphatase RsbU (regulator of sigma subunit)/CHASE2 domain-containing sensor protein
LIIDKPTARRVTLLWVVFSFAVAHLLHWLFPVALSMWDEQIIDRYLRLRDNLGSFRPAYEDVIVHVDLNNTSLQRLNDFYPDRAHHARVIENLTEMNVASQMYDFVFAGPTVPEEDRKLIEATQNSHDIFFGLVFFLAEETGSEPIPVEDSPAHRYLERTLWNLDPDSRAPEFFQGLRPVITLPEIAEESRGLGFLSLNPDRDGIFRRLPLLVRYRQGFYPSFALRAICSYLNVTPENLRVEADALVLANARRPGSDQRSRIVVPIDAHGNMRINFVGAWGRMKHYHFSDVYFASDDREEMGLWREELAGKIVLVSDVSTGSTDVGKIPVDNNFPLSGIHANAVHTVLTGEFLKEISPWTARLLEILVLAAVGLLSLHRSAVVFTLGTFGIGIAYLTVAGAGLFLANVLLPIVRPILMSALALITLYVASALANARSWVETEKARQMAERELEIGRNIQAGFLPAVWPSPAGWEIAAYFKPARQVAGDFYDIFELDRGKYIGIVIADVCDKGVGAALFMALIRSLVRAFSIRDFDRFSQPEDAAPAGPEAALLNTIHQTNNYIATTHDDASMFATLFLGALDPRSGRLQYVNCGHEPPVVISSGKIQARLKRTGPAVGMIPEVAYAVDSICLEGGDFLFLYTDGLTDAQNEKGELFGRERLTLMINGAFDTAETFIERVNRRLDQHAGATARFDDITLVVVRREPEFRAHG